MVSIAQKIFSKKFELAVSKVRLKSNLDYNTIQSEKKVRKKLKMVGFEPMVTPHRGPFGPKMIFTELNQNGKNQ